MDFEKWPYKNPAELIFAMRGIDPDLISQLKWNIVVEKKWVSVVFYVSDPADYAIISEKWMPWVDYKPSGWLQTETRDWIPYMVTNGKKWGDYVDKSVVIHEYRHVLNSYTMYEKINWNHKQTEKKWWWWYAYRAKDELLAYWKDGYRTFDGVQETLVDEHGLYNYYEWSTLPHQNYKDKWNTHVEYIKKNTAILQDFDAWIKKYPELGITKDVMINILSVNSFHSREKLHTLFLRNIQEYEKSLMWKDTLKNKILSFLNKNKNITMPWWCGAENINSLVSVLNNVKTSQDLKHIILDPKYSHIEFGDEKISSFELYARLEKVIKGNLDISYVPIEFRKIIQNIKQ